MLAAAALVGRQMAVEVAAQEVAAPPGPLDNQIRAAAAALLHLEMLAVPAAPAS
jgi:hypothetical protein